MAGFFSVFKSKQFYLHMSISLGILVVLLLILIKSLSFYTGHNEFVEVPDYINKQIPELPAFNEGRSVNYIIVDSIYDPQSKAGIVIRQDPSPNSKVKHNRNVYLYVTSLVPPQVIMPKLVDRSERQARLIISSYGLKVGNTTTKSADCNGCIIEQLYKGEAIEPGTLVKKGCKIDLVIGVKDIYYTPAAGDSLGGGAQKAFNEEDE